MPPAPTDAPAPTDTPPSEDALDDLAAASGAPPSADEPDASPGEGEAPARKPRKARKNKADGDPYRAPDEATDATWRPAFARHYPRHPELDRLLRSFIEGDFATVHREAPALAGRTDDPDVARAARDLRRRLDPDRVSLLLLAMMAALLLFLVLWFYSHRYHAH